MTHFDNLFHKAYNATTDSTFNFVLKEHETLCRGAHKYFMDKDPKTWSMDYYKTGRCCDLVETGGNESLNAVILDARKKPTLH